MLINILTQVVIISIFTILYSFSLQASSHQLKINQSYQPNLNQPYGLFFADVDKHEIENEIFAAPTLKTDVHVDVQGLLTTTTVKQYFINPTIPGWRLFIYSRFPINLRLIFLE